MFQQESVGELKGILQALKSKLAKYDEDSARDKKKDYELFPSEKLDYILRGKIPSQEKKKLLLNQIGLIRINLFMEYFDRIRVLEENSQLDEALRLMNDYASNIAIPFMRTKKQQSLINRFVDLIAREKQLEPLEYIQKWKTEYHSWFEGDSGLSHLKIRENKKQERFGQMKMIFHMLYTLSFSDDNFPPSPTIIFVEER